MKRTFYLISCVWVTSRLFALPEKGNVAAGHAEFQQSQDHTLKIKTSNKAIINYEKFHIAEKEHVEFIQPSSKSAVLNRINGKNPSQISSFKNPYEQQIRTPTLVN